MSRRKPPAERTMRSYLRRERPHFLDLVADGALSLSVAYGAALALRRAEEKEAAQAKRKAMMPQVGDLWRRMGYEPPVTLDDHMPFAWLLLVHWPEMADMVVHEDYPMVQAVRSLLKWQPDLAAELDVPAVSAAERQAAEERRDFFMKSNGCPT